MKLRILLATLLVASATYAQNAPLPSNPALPVERFVGRYVDSTATRDYQSPVRTYRARRMRIAPELDRVFVMMGNTFGAYRLSTFFTQELGQPLTPLLGYREHYLPFLMSVDPERTGSGWSVPLVDGQTWLRGFDWDDRGNILLGYTIWKWGIVNAEGVLLHQHTTAAEGESAVVPNEVISVRAGDEYFALVSNAYNSASPPPALNVFNVTDPANPVFVRTLSFAVRSFAKVGNRVAIVDNQKALRIYDASSLVAGDAALFTHPLQAIAVSADGNSFIATNQVGSTSRINPDDDTYESVELLPAPAAMAVLTSAATGEYAAQLGWSTPSYSRVLKLYRVAGSEVIALPAPAVAEGIASYVDMLDLTLVTVGATTYLNLSLYGVGDVYALRPSITADATRDFASDVFWREQNGATNALWSNLQHGVQGELLPYVPQPWEMKGIGDSDADARADMFWRNPVTGENAIWLLNGSGVTGVMLPTVEVNWRVAGMADLDGDRRSDVVWRNESTGDNAVWFMNGSEIKRGAMLPTVPLDWTIGELGDFDGDGFSDVFWRHTSGDNAVWLMNGDAVKSGSYLPNVPLTLSTRGVGDFNRDGKADIVWRNPTTGENAIWFLNGGAVLSGQYLPTVDSSMDIVMVGDFNPFADPSHTDGADILWRNSATGENAVWYIRSEFGQLSVSGQYLPTVNNMNVIAP